MSLILTYFWAKKKNYTIFRPPRCFRKKLTDLTYTLHSVTTLPLLNYAPVHIFPLPVYPSLQTQRYELIVLLQCAFTWQAEGEELHSLMSETDINNILIKLNLKYYMLYRPSVSQVRQKVPNQKWQIIKWTEKRRICWFSPNA